MSAPVLSTVFQIGVDNAMITVPQTYTVPTNPPSEPNPPSNTSVPTNTSTATTKDSVTIYASSIKGFKNPLTMSFFIRAIDHYLDPTLPPINDTIAPWVGNIGSTHLNWVPGTLNIAVSSATCSGTTRTVLTDTTLALATNALVGYTLTYTSGPASGQSQVIISNTATTITTAAFLPPPHAPTPGGGDTYQVYLGWKGALPFSLTPTGSSTNTALNTYVALNYQTLWINPENTGGTIDPNFPPSYLVTIYAVDTSTTPNTFASCSFTIVIMPSIANYGLGIEERIKGGDGKFVFGNSVELKKDGYASTPKSVAYVDFNFYPLESTSLVPNVAPNPVAISLDYFNAGNGNGGIIDDINSTINGIALGGYGNGTIVLPSGFSRDTVSSTVSLVLYLNGTASATDGIPTHAHSLIRITGTDSQGVTASAYLIIQVAE